jgi:hypothetical protein
VEELECCTVGETTIDTTCISYSKTEALATILIPNSVLIVDSEIMKTDHSFFDALVNPDIEKRLIIIAHSGGFADWMSNYAELKNVCVLFDNFSQLYFMGVVYDPSRAHRNAIDFIKMRAKLWEEEIGGSWSISESAFVYLIKEGTQCKFQGIKSQLQNILRDYSYFRVSLK